MDRHELGTIWTYFMISLFILYLVFDVVKNEKKLSNNTIGDENLVFDVVYFLDKDFHDSS